MGFAKEQMLEQRPQHQEVDLAVQMSVRVDRPSWLRWTMPQLISVRQTECEAWKTPLPPKDVSS